MIKIKNVTIKNFLSIGNVTQSVNFKDSGLMLVLGKNVDLGDEDARNGTGKTTILNALSYALFGSAISNIKLNNLINKSNSKGMLVTVEFDIDGDRYRIERGRRPNFLKFIINNNEMTDEETDEGQGEMRLTQKEIDRTLGLNHTLFKHLMALNTYTEPFLGLRAYDQREIIEHLLGITILSEKATVLKDLVRDNKDELKEEQYRIKGIENANVQFEKSISELKRKQTVWVRDREEKLNTLNEEIKTLKEFDIEEELLNHIELEKYTGACKKLDDLAGDALDKIDEIEKEEKRSDDSHEELKLALEFKCYACGQPIHDEAHEKIVADRQGIIDECAVNIKKIRKELGVIQQKIESIGDIGDKPQTVYESASIAYEHYSKLSTLEDKFNSLTQTEDPYTEQIEQLQSEGIQKIDWSGVNELHNLLEHQEFMLKLLTNKDSFIRKRIIEQNLQYLNGRLNYYLVELGLPHEVKFKNDLSVEITDLGRDLDFDNLSRGEQTRLSLGLSWSFRDVFESMNQPIDFIAVDEILDNGLDLMGLEASIKVLKHMQRARNKNILLISHKEELVGRVSNVLYVQKENGFTSFSTT